MKLSIITVNRNNPEGLRRTLESVLSQTRTTDYEQIVIDGASDRGDVEVLKELSGRFEERAIPFTYVSEPDSGIYNAMNKGIRKANGEYCLFLNSGDAFYDDRVMEDVLAFGLDADYVCGNEWCEKSQWLGAHAFCSPEKLRASDVILRTLPHQASFIKKDLFERLHYYDESYRAVSDYLFAMEALVVRGATYKHIQRYIASCEMEGLTVQPKNVAMVNKENRMGRESVIPFFDEDYQELTSSRDERRSEHYKLIQKIGRSKWFALFVKLRQFMIRTGWYARIAKWKLRRYFHQLQKKDARKKREVARLIQSLPKDMLKRNGDASDVIVSLTSYGKRVTDAVPYAVYSLFQQSELPNRIVLFLDERKWNEGNIPSLLKRLQQSGLEIVYGEDVRSYTKLLPALKLFPDNPIITVDDDLYYDKEVVALLKREYEHSDKKTPIALHGNIAVRRNGKYVPYSEWPDCAYGDETCDYSLYGVHGAIYPPHIFDEEVFNKEVFLKLAPYADDIWFWIQEKRLGIRTKVVRSFNSHRNVSVNRIEEMDFSQTGTLFFQNVVSGRNDEQLEKLLNHYQM
ncbi:MAG: glycosyltransferase [Paludibacteraceae bacterium]|nr:glycosyltransferase [Paludibacteraceae bacterium]